jgi:chemotaxis protein methyltransferase CheR
MQPDNRFNHITIGSDEYKKIKNLVYEISGIDLKDNKHSLVESRLMKRLRIHSLASYDEYYQLVTKDTIELQWMIDQITTNETSFFRENKHFDYIKHKILPQVQGKINVWSAAASVGVEAYTIAMILDETLSRKFLPFQILGSDINLDVLQQAKEGVYESKLSENIPIEYLRRYCLKGIGPLEGKFAIDEYLKSKVSFRQLNLTKPIGSEVGMFDMIFLRNVLIYFDIETKQKVVQNVLRHLKPNGYFFIGHSETLFNISDEVVQVMPTVYQKR